MIYLTYTYYEVSFLLPGGTFEQQKVLKEQEEIRRGLEKEIDNLNLETNKQRKMIDSLEKERDRWGYILLIIYNIIFSLKKLVVKMCQCVRFCLKM